MTTSAHSFARDLVFRPHPHIVAGKIVVLLGIGGGMLLAGIIHASVLTLPAVLITLMLALRIAYLELATCLIVRGDTLFAAVWLDPPPGRTHCPPSRRRDDDAESGRSPAGLRSHHVYLR
jgi:hypothetical protein